jgi:hypothetical protein
MNKFRLWQLAFPLLFTACQTTDCSKMSSQIDSLKREINSGGQMVNAVVSVNSLLDSIDATRHTLRVHHVTGEERHRYDERMLELKDYVQQTENKIGELEASMIETSVNSESYLAIISALKDELRMRNEELGLIDENAELNNEELLRSVQLEDLEARLEVKKMELLLLELRITEMVRAMNISEADGLFISAAALEEAAKRTKLAPFKRRQALRQAVELYEKSLAKGNSDAKAKIEELQAKVDPYDN